MVDEAKNATQAIPPVAEVKKEEMPAKVVEAEKVGVHMKIEKIEEAQVIPADAKPQKVKKPEAVVEKVKVDEEYVICPKCGEMINKDFFEGNKKLRQVEKEAEKPVEGLEKKEYTARAEETGDKVYYVKDGQRFWVKNPETLAKLGFRLGQERNIPFTELLKFPEGEPLDLTLPGATVEDIGKEVVKPPEPDKPYKVWS